MSNDNIFLINNQIRSQAGKARAEKLSPEERTAIAKFANQSKKCMLKYPKATHSGELKIGEANISCAVLNDGRRVITESSMFEILGRKRRGRKSAEQIPAFLAANNLKSLIPSDFLSGNTILEFISKFGQKSYGYDATIIPEICKIYLEGRKLGILTQNQLPLADVAEKLLFSLSKVGITALIDEATGYERFKENNDLAKLFDKFIAQELQPWTKRFPNSFFENIKRMYGLEHLKGNPKFAGHLINKYIYNEISPEVLDELKRINPIKESGRRAFVHHRLLTEDVGHPTLEKQILKINTLMAASDSKEEFEFLFEKCNRNKKEI